MTTVNFAKEMAGENEAFKLQANDAQTGFDCDPEKMVALGYPGAKISLFIFVNLYHHLEVRIIFTMWHVYMYSRYMRSLVALCSHFHG